MSTTSIRRLATPVVVILVLALAAAALVGAGIAIGSSSRSLAGSGPTGGCAAATGDAIAGDLDALLAADQSTAPAAKVANPNKSVPGLRRLAAGSRLVHGTVLVDLPALGGLTTIQVDHGTIKTVGPTSLSVSETGGTTATVSLGDETRVRKHAAKAKVGDLAVGDEVFVMSKVAGGATEAYLVVVPAS
jgi:hypothetical protein